MFRASCSRCATEVATDASDGLDLGGRFLPTRQIQLGDERFRVVGGTDTAGWLNIS